MPSRQWFCVSGCNSPVTPYISLVLLEQINIFGSKYPYNIEYRVIWKQSPCMHSYVLIMNAYLLWPCSFSSLVSQCLIFYRMKVSPKNLIRILKQGHWMQVCTHSGRPTTMALQLQLPLIGAPFDFRTVRPLISASSVLFSKLNKTFFWILWSRKYLFR